MRVIQEDRVEHVPRGRIEAEGDVRETEHELAVRQLRRDALDRVQRVQAELSVVVVAGADGEGQRVDDEIGLGQPEPAAGEIAQALGEGDFVLGLLRHTLLVDGERNHRGAEAARQLHALLRRRLAVLEIDRVDHGLAAVQLERGLEHAEFRRIENERRRHAAAHAAHRLGHVGDLIAADEGGAEVEGVRALLNLLARHLDAAVPVASLLALPELLGAIGVAALADREVGVLLAKCHRLIERGERGHPVALALHGRRAFARTAQPLQHLVEGGDVRGRGAAAAADQVDAVLEDETLLPLRELLRGERVMRLAVDELGQTRVGLHRDQSRPALPQPLHVLGHLLRTGRAVDADQRHGERIDDGRGRRDVGAHQQGAGGLDGHLHEDRRLGAGFGACALGAVDGGLELQGVLAGLDQDRLGAAGDQPRRLDRERVLKGLVIDMTERRQPRPRPDRADDEARAAVAGEFLAHLECELDGALVEIEGAVLQPELAERHGRAAEGVGLDRVRARAKIAAIDLAHQVRPALVQDLRAVLMAPEIAIDMERARLDLGPHRAVAEKDAVFQIIEKMCHVPPA